MYENTVENIIKAQNGDEEIMTKLIEENNGLIWSIVKRFTGRGHDVEDIFQIGAMGFIKAIKRFDTKFDAKLTTYAVPYIIGEIKRFLRDDSMLKVSRSLKELAIKIKELQKKYLDERGEEIGVVKLAEILKVPKEDVIAALEATSNVESIYAEVYQDYKEDGSISLVDTISSKNDDMAKISDKIALKQAISELKNREKEIIYLRFFKDKTQMQVAKILGITQVQVSRIERKVLDFMKIKLIS